MKWLLLCVALVNCNPAFAHNMTCASREKVIARLADEYDERQRALGMTDKRQIVELWTSDAGGWTLLLSLPHGKSCLIAGGKGWQIIEPKAPAPKGDPA